jgi:hypothetical protein
VQDDQPEDDEENAGGQEVTGRESPRRPIRLDYRLRWIGEFVL